MSERDFAEIVRITVPEGVNWDDAEWTFNSNLLNDLKEKFTRVDDAKQEGDAP